jgi:hypothetical protein
VATALSVDLDPGIADILRMKDSLPHQFNPPSTWVALDYLAAVRLDERLWFSNGRTLWSSAEDAWRFADHPDIARIIAAHPYPRDEAVQAVPRAFPLGALGPDQMLWGLRWYDTDHEYVCTPLVLDAARREVQVLSSADGGRIGGTAPRRRLTTDDPHRFVIAGQIDAGAVFHIDEYIMVDVAWEVDLARGTYRSAPPVHGTPCSRLVAVSPHQTLSREGLSYRSRVIDLDSKWVFTARDNDDVLMLDLRAFDRATVRVIDYEMALQIGRPSCHLS